MKPGDTVTYGFVALTDIEPGQELLLHYGDRYSRNYKPGSRGRDLDWSKIKAVAPSRKEQRREESDILVEPPTPARGPEKMITEKPSPSNREPRLGELWKAEKERGEKRRKFEEK